jgi:hypothetical protein
MAENEFSNFLVGRPLSEEDRTTFPDGAHSPLDYRSVIHGLIRETYGGGQRQIQDFDYDKFFAATDTLFDVGEMLYMAEACEWPSNESLGKLQMYGVFQALAVQQQAVRQLMKCFGYKDILASADQLASINEYRIAVAGHPSDHTQNRHQMKGCSFLGHRVSGSRHRFNFVTYENFQKSHIREVDVIDLIKKQKIAIELNLALIWKQIKDDPKYHENSSVENVL